MALAVALLFGPLALAFDQGLSYVLVKWACATGTTSVFGGIALIAVGMTAAGALSGWSLVLSLRAADGRGGTPRDPRYFMAIVGIALNALVALLIITAVVPRQLLSPCE
jgi:hypothetical protein